MLFYNAAVFVFLNHHQVEPAVGAALVAWNFCMKESIENAFKS